MAANHAQCLQPLWFMCFINYYIEKPSNIINMLEQTFLQSCVGIYGKS